MVIVSHLVIITINSVVIVSHMSLMSLMKWWCVVVDSQSYGDHIVYITINSVVIVSRCLRK